MPIWRTASGDVVVVGSKEELEELAIDPSIYFFVDEIAISLRAYTLGYDLFHPHRILGWHLYNRSTRVTHWDSNSTAAVRSEVTGVALGYAAAPKNPFERVKSRLETDVKQLKEHVA